MSERPIESDGQLMVMPGCAPDKVGDAFSGHVIQPKGNTGPLVHLYPLSTTDGRRSVGNQ